LLIRLLIRHESVQGIRVAHTCPDFLANPLDFRKEIDAALRLLERVDALSYRRVLKYCPAIDSALLLPSDASYDGLRKTCSINAKRLSSLEPKNRTLWIAELLTHEAIHGLLHAKLIPHTKRLRPRIERTCVKRQRRFLKLFGWERASVCTASAEASI